MAICFWPEFQQVEATGGSSAPPVITVNSQWTIVVADPESSPCYVILPSTAGEVGDLVEVRSANLEVSRISVIKEPNGYSWGVGVSFRKISPTVWCGT